MHAGQWRKSAKGSHELRGRTLGIVGYGKIGSQLSVLAEALGMRVQFFDTADRLALGNARRCATLDELLAEADVVTLHVDGRPGNSSPVRRGRVRPDEARRDLPQPLPRLRGRPRGAAAAHRQRPRGRRRRRRLPLGAVRRRATRSSPSCAACPTSSSPRTSAAPPRRRSRTSASSSRASCSATSPPAPPRCRSTFPRSQLDRSPGTSRLLLLHQNRPGRAGPPQRRPGDVGLNIEQQILVHGRHRRLRRHRREQRRSRSR